MVMRSVATDLGATVGSSSKRLAVSLIEAAKLRLQHSGELIISPNTIEWSLGA